MGFCMGNANHHSKNSHWNKQFPHCCKLTENNYCNTNCYPECSLTPGDGDSGACTDLNECEVNNGGCEHICTNTDGSYECSCYDGYALNTDGHTCSDVDECALGIADCEQICTNTDGSYECSCDDGYVLKPDCHTCCDVDECELGIDDCEHICTNTYGSYECSCLPGFILHPDGHTCCELALDFHPLISAHT